MYQVRLAREAQRSFDRAEAPLQRKLSRCFDSLRTRPRRHANARPLRGSLAGYFRYRIGDWRMIYRIDQAANTVWVVCIEHRREVYR